MTLLETMPAFYVQGSQRIAHRGRLGPDTAAEHVLAAMRLRGHLVQSGPRPKDVSMRALAAFVDAPAGDLVRPDAWAHRPAPEQWFWLLPRNAPTPTWGRLLEAGWGPQALKDISVLGDRAQQADSPLAHWAWSGDLSFSDARTAAEVLIQVWEHALACGAHTAQVMPWLEVLAQAPGGLLVEGRGVVAGWSAGPGASVPVLMERWGASAALAWAAGMGADDLPTQVPRADLARLAALRGFRALPEAPQRQAV